MGGGGFLLKRHRIPCFYMGKNFQIVRYKLKWRIKIFGFTCIIQIKFATKKKSNSKLDNKEDYYYHQKARNMNTENKQLTIVRKKQNTIVRIIIGI